eukprot:scaffold44303_cov78-Phaeocystis_antarctica.AAC.1
MHAALAAPAVARASDALRRARRTAGGMRTHAAGRHALMACALLGGVAAVGAALLVGPHLGSLLATPLVSFWQRFCTDVRTFCVLLFATVLGLLFGFGQLGWLD